MTTIALYRGQRLLVSLLAALGGRIGNLDFQKLLFLYCQEQGSQAPYEFVPYRFGAFSFTCYADRRRLIERGILRDEEGCWSLTVEGHRVASALHSSDDLHDISVFARRECLRGDALVAETYRRYPYYAIRSEMVDRLLRGEDEVLERIRVAKGSPGPGALLTIGYEGRSLERYLNDLVRAKVSLLCDVRRNPISRKYGFSKTTLAKGCVGVGVSYEHVPELGIASEQRRELVSQADYDALFAEYEKTYLPHQGAALAQIRTWIHSGHRVALTCYERMPHQCHRHCVADALATQLGDTGAPTHL